jgi:thymidylate synthase
MKPVFVEGKTLDDTWFKLLSEVYKHGRINHIDNGSYAGSDRLEFDAVFGTIHYPTTRPLAPIMPEGLPPVTTDEDIEKYFVTYLMDGTLEDNEHYKYATWIGGGLYKLPKFEYYGEKTFALNDEETEYGTTKYIAHDLNKIVYVPNQIQWCIDHYKAKGFGNNHCYIQVGYPESNAAYDQPYENEMDRGTSPCLRGIDTAIKDGKLDFHVYFRSWDLYGAWPENMAGMVMLMEYMANELGVDVGTLSFSSLKLHCYSHTTDVLKARLGIK